MVVKYRLFPINVTINHVILRVILRQSQLCFNVFLYIKVKISYNCILKYIIITALQSPVDSMYYKLQFNFEQRLPRIVQLIFTIADSETLHCIKIFAAFY